MTAKGRNNFQCFPKRSCISYKQLGLITRMSVCKSLLKDRLRYSERVTENRSGMDCMPWWGQANMGHNGPKNKQAVGFCFCSCALPRSTEYFCSGPSPAMHVLSCDCREESGMERDCGGVYLWSDLPEGWEFVWAFFFPEYLYNHLSFHALIALMWQPPPPAAGGRFVCRAARLHQILS